MDPLLAWSTFALAALTLILVTIALGALLVGRGQLAAAREAIETQTSWNRAQSTLEYFTAWRAENEPRRAALDTYLSANSNDLGSPLQRGQFVDVANAAGPVLEGLEQMALGVRCDVYDLNIIYQLARGYIDHYYPKCLPFIHEVRRGSPARDPQPSVYEHVEWLAGRLKAMESGVSPRRALAA